MVFWNPDTVAFSLGPLELRWYSLFWCIGLAAAYLLMQRLYRQQQLGDDKFEPLFLYCFVGILVGARLGHCLLYQPGYFLSHPIEMLLPIRQTAEGWRCTGYAGLASHGGTLGLMLALWLYVRRTRLNLMRVLDNIAIVTPITACCIRLGNLMNSEIVGKPTGSDWGFVFLRLGEDFPRHPGQLYEAVAYFVFFLLTLAFYRRWKEKVGTGFYFGWCLTSIFAFRFFVEMFKEVQEPWELTMVETIGLNQGQLLSIPFVVLGLYCLLGGKSAVHWAKSAIKWPDSAFLYCSGIVFLRNVQKILPEPLKKCVESRAVSFQIRKFAAGLCVGMCRLSCNIVAVFFKGLAERCGQRAQTAFIPFSLAVLEN